MALMNRFPIPLKYALPLAVVMVLASIAFQLVIRPFVGEIVFLAIYPVIFLSAWICGTIPSIVSLIIAFFVVDYIFIGPAQTIGIYELKDVIRILFFLLNNVLIIWALYRMRKAESESSDHLGKALNSELRYRTIVELSPHMIWFSDKDGSNTYNNQTWYEYTGLSYEESRSFSWSKVIHPSDREQVVSAWMDAIHNVRPYQVELRLRRRDGEYRWFLARGKPILNEIGEVERWIGKAVDFHEQKMAITTRDVFFSMTSHELKTPLTALKLKMQVMEKKIKDNDEEARDFNHLGKFIDSTLHSVSHFHGLIDEMLDVSRITSGKMNYSFGPSEAKDVILRSVEMVSNEYTSSKVSLKIHTPEEITFQGDSQKVVQVVVNLLTNALKYGNNKPVQIKLAKQEETFTIEVQDQGLGISETNQKRIFECFERLDETKVSGLGVGLFISRQIIEAHQGEILLYSKLNEGSTFTVILPLKHG